MKKPQQKRASTRVRSRTVSSGTVKIGKIVVFPCGEQVCSLVVTVYIF